MIPAGPTGAVSKADRKIFPFYPPRGNLIAWRMACVLPVRELIRQAGVCPQTPAQLQKVICPQRSACPFVWGHHGLHILLNLKEI